MDKTKRIEAFEKVKKVIESCTTQQQLIGADNMIDGFKNIYGYGVYSIALDRLWIDRCYDDDIDFEGNSSTNESDWQPCGRAYQEAGNAENQMDKHVYGC